MKYTIACELCGLVCSMQVSATHLKAKHGMTTAEYKALGYETLSEARLTQLQQSDFSKGKVKRLYGEDHPNWKGGCIARNGYRLVSRMGKSCLYEHRLVAEETLGRPLTSDEVVHHIDGNRSNNHPDNLQVMTKREHDRTPREGIKRVFNTGPDCEAASRILRQHGWSIRRIALALRVEDATVSRWQRQPVWTDEFLVTD